MRDGAKPKSYSLPYSNLFYKLLDKQMNAKTKLLTPIYNEQQINTIVRSIIESKPDNLFAEVMQVFEKPLIEELLLQERGNQTRVALRLGLNRGTLRKKLHLHGILKEVN